MKLALPLLPLTLLSCSPGPSAGADIEVRDAWARSTPPGRSATAAYLTISNRGTADDALTGVTVNNGRAALHSTSMAGGIMRMRGLARLPLPPGSTVELAPGGTHLMLTELREPLVPGQKIELSLAFEKSAPRKVATQVRPSGEQM